MKCNNRKIFYISNVIENEYCTKNIERCFQCNVNESEIKLVYCKYDKISMRPIINCFQTYQLHSVLSYYNGEEINLQKQNGKCTIRGEMIINEIQSNTDFDLDTGSDVDIISITQLNKLFPTVKFKFTQSNAKLIGANSKEIKVLGMLPIKCNIGNKTLILQFYVIVPGTVILLSWNSIKAFNLIIDTSINEIRTVNSIDQIIQNNIGNENSYIIFTPIFDLFDFRNHVITLKPVLNKFNQCLLYRYISIYRCNCKVNGFTLCKDCLKIGPYTTIFLTGQIFDIKFQNKEEINLTENYNFQGVQFLDRTHQVRSSSKSKESYNNFNQNDQIRQIRNQYGQGQELDNYWWDNDISQNNTKSLSSVTQDQENYYEHVYKTETVSLDDIIQNDTDYDVEPASWELKGNDVYYNHPIISLTPDNWLDSNNPIHDIDLQQAVNDQLCSFCKQVGHNYCDVFDTSCIQNIKFRKELDLEEVNCEIIDNFEAAKFCNIKVAMILTTKDEMFDNFQWFRNIKQDYLQFKETFQKSASYCDYFIVNKNNKTFILLLMKNKMHFRTVETLNAIKIYCINNSIKEIHFINFEYILISKNCLMTIFCNLYIKIYINDFQIKKILKIDLDPDRVKIDGKVMEKLNFQNVINPLKITQSTKDKLHILFQELDQVIPGQRSLFARSSLDVGTFHSAKYPYNVFKFDFKVKKDMENYQPIKERSRFVNPKLKQEATKMINGLIDAGIVSTGYSPWNSQTLYIPRKLDITLEEFVKQGNKPEDFIPGTSDKKNVGLRICHAYQQVNSILEEGTLTQPSPIQLLKSIAFNAKYINVLDITGSYFSCALSEKSKIFTGFESGLGGPANALIYNKLPQGIICSKSIQDSGLYFCMEGIQNTLLYSDNLISWSDSEENNFELLKQQFLALKAHGFTLKLSKLSLFCSENISLFGYIIRIPDKRITIQYDKILSLKNKITPESIKHTKQFLGSLQFLMPYFPLIDTSIETLHMMTRQGGNFHWSENNLRAYETVLKLLTMPNLIFSYLPNYEHEILATCDSSLKRASWIFWQNYDNKPKVLSYNHKTFPNSHAAYPPSLLELIGVLFCCKQALIEYNGIKVTLYTDCLPLTMCTLSSYYNSRIARIKIFLQSLGWLRIKHIGAENPIIQYCDFWSRNTENQNKRFSNKMPSQRDVEICNKVSKKVDMSKEYSTKQIFFVLDYLLSLSESQIDKIEEKSVYLDEGQLKYISEGTEKTLSNKDVLDRNTFNETQLISEPKYEYDKCGKWNLVDFSTKSDQIANPNSCNKVESEYENVQLCKLVTTRLRSQLQKIPVIFNETENEVIKDLEFYINPIESKGTTTFKSRNNVTDFQKCNQLSPFQNYFKKLREKIPFLSLDKFRNSQKCCSKLGPIIEECKRRKTFIENNKMFFLHEGILFCKEKIKGLEFFKMCLTTHTSWDLCNYAHRKQGHLSKERLINYLNQTFYIPQIHFIIGEIIDQCQLCSSVLKRTAGSSRPNFPKQTTLLRKAKIAYYFDELLIYKDRNIHIKAIVGICAFSHYCLIKVLPENQNVTSKIFLQFLQEIQDFTSNSMLYCCTDNDSRLNSQQIIDSCQELGITKLTTLAYQAKSNLAEMMCRIILDTVRVQIAQTGAIREVINKTIKQAVMWINKSTFYNSKVLSPYALYFLEKPVSEFSFEYLSEKDYVSKESYFQHVLKLANIYKRLRKLQIDQRLKQNDSRFPGSQKYHDKIQIGSIVSICNRYRMRNRGSKLLPLYADRFLVMNRSKSSLLLKVLDTVDIQTYMDLNKQDRIEKEISEKDQALLIKADISHVKLVKPNLIYNDKMDFYSAWFKKWIMPKSMYVSDKYSGSLLEWYQLYDQNDDESQYEMAEKVFNVNYFNQLNRNIPQSIQSYKSILVSEQNSVIKSLQKDLDKVYNRHRQQKKVQFCSQVKVVNILGNNIYYCVRSEDIKLH